MLRTKSFRSAGPWHTTHGPSAQYPTRTLVAHALGGHITTRDVTVYRQPTFDGGMRKYAGWRPERLDPERATLDAVAALARTPYRGVLRRRPAAVRP